MRESLKYINRSTLGKKEGLVGAEVGVREGKNALAMLQSMNIKSLYLIDHWKEYTEASGHVITQEQQDNFFKNMSQILYTFCDKIIIRRMSSADASDIIEDNSLDFVYIDGDHSYEAVKNDMKLWFKKVKEGGFLCGHDFGNPCTPDVAKAVKDFSSENGLTVHKLDDIDWLIFRPQ